MEAFSLAPGNFFQIGDMVPADRRLTSHKLMFQLEAYLVISNSCIWYCTVDEFSKG